MVEHSRINCVVGFLILGLEAQIFFVIDNFDRGNTMVHAQLHACNFDVYGQPIV